MPATSRLAWLLRAICALQLLAMLGVLWWRWPISPLQAIAGALAIAAIAPAALALEFVLLARVGRGDPVPRASAMQMARAWMGEVADLVRVFYWRLPLRWRAVPDLLDASCAGRTGVVLIHGFVCNRGIWAPWLQELQARRHASVAVNLEPVFASIDAYANRIEAAVQQLTQCTGRPPVLVCHSMGGLAARAWLRTANNAHRVAHVVTIGTPHHGTWLGRFSSVRNGREMRQDSAWLAELARTERGRPRPPFTCWYSNCDNIVFPPSTATLPGADNRFLPGVAHVTMVFEPAVLAHALQILKAPNPPP